MNIPLFLGLLSSLAILGIFGGIYLGTRPKNALNKASILVTPEENDPSKLMEWVRFYRKTETSDDETIIWLKKSGNPNGWSVNDFKAARVQKSLVFAGLGAGLVFLLSLLTSMWLLITLSPAVGLLGLWFGFGQPKRKLIGAYKKRVIYVTLQMPSLLTLLSLADGAGYTPEGALKLATNELEEGTLKGEMDIVLQLLSTGSPFVGALANFRERVPCPIVEEFTQKLYDGSITGQSLSKSLTDLAEVAFAERTAAMELSAQKASQKIMFVVVPALILPADVAVLMYPIISTLQQGLGGG